MHLTSARHDWEVCHRRIAYRHRHNPADLSTQFWQTETGPIEAVYNRTQLRKYVYSSYTAMLRGTIKDPPPRRNVLQLAAYLDCDSVETDDLLLAAGYYTQPVFLEGAERDRMIAFGASVAEQFPAPALVITRDWHIHHMNTTAKLVLNLTDEALRKPTFHLNLMDLLIDPQSPAYRVIAAAQPSALSGAMRLAIATFRRDNVMCEQEPWYAACLKRWLALPAPVNPEFAQIWSEVRYDLRGSPTQPDSAAQHNAWFTIQFAGPGGSPIRLRPMSLSFPTFSFPRVIGFFPAD
jgi:hypothetical protein